MLSSRTQRFTTSIRPEVGTRSTSTPKLWSGTANNLICIYITFSSHFYPPSKVTYPKVQIDTFIISMHSLRASNLWPSCYHFAPLVALVTEIKKHWSVIIWSTKTHLNQNRSGHWGGFWHYYFPSGSIVLWRKGEWLPVIPCRHCDKMATCWSSGKLIGNSSYLEWACHTK